MSTPVKKSTTIAANATKKGHMQWDIPGARTLLYVLHTRFPYWIATQYALVFNEMFCDKLKEMGLRDGIDNSRLGSEWRSQRKGNSKHKWAKVLAEGDDQTDEEERMRDRWEALVLLAAPRVGLVTKKTEEIEEEEDDLEMEEDEVNSVKKATLCAEAAAFRRMHSKSE